MPQDEKDKPKTAAARDAGPGPGRYMLPSTLGCEKTDLRKYKNPCYSFGLKTRPPGAKSQSPGPQYQVQTHPTGHIPGSGYTPGFTMGVKLGSSKKSTTPGPNNYRPEEYLPLGSHSPKYIFGLRTPMGGRSITPGPNKYAIASTIGSGPQIAMKSRHEMKQSSATPGPNNYKLVHTDLYKTKSPDVKMGIRLDYKKAFASPGPGAYSPEMCNLNKPGVPMFSFGSKHSDYLAPVIFEEDSVHTETTREENARPCKCEDS